MTEAERALVEACVNGSGAFYEARAAYHYATKVAQERLPADVVAAYKQKIREHIVAQRAMNAMAQRLPAIALSGEKGLTCQLWDEVTKELDE